MNENIIPLIPKPVETEEQKQYWVEQLEIAERKREYCMRRLGILTVEKGVSEGD